MQFDTPRAGGLPPAAPPPPVHFVESAPLGGVTPHVAEEAPPSDRHDLLLTALLLVLAIAAGAASVMPWRDFGRQFGQVTVETGWNGPGSTLGRGWVAVALGVALAVAGVLLASGRRRSGRIVAVLGGLGLVALGVGEWGFGAGDLRVGPGAGLWALLVIGTLTVIGVGMLSPSPRDDGDTSESSADAGPSTP